MEEDESKSTGGGGGRNPQREQVGDTGAFLVQRLCMTPHILGVSDFKTLLN